MSNRMKSYSSHSKPAESVGLMFAKPKSLTNKMEVISIVDGQTNQMSVQGNVQKRKHNSQCVHGLTSLRLFYAQREDKNDQWTLSAIAVLIGMQEDVDG